MEDIDLELDWFVDAALDDEMPRARSGDFVTFSAEKKPTPLHSPPSPPAMVVIEMEAEEPPIDDLWGDDWGETTVVDVGTVVVAREVNGRRVPAGDQPVIG